VTRPVPEPTVAAAPIAGAITPRWGLCGVMLFFDGLHPSLADCAPLGLVWYVVIFRWAAPIAGGLCLVGAFYRE
jgi:hypothetical protein